MSGLEEAKDRTEATLRDLCLNGPRVDLTMQETVDACLVPNLDWLLTRASTKTFSQGQVCSFVVEWALEHKSYPLLQYLLLNGWDINHPRSRKLCPSWLGLPCVLKNSDLVSWLLSRGADPGIGTIPTRTPRRPGENNGTIGWLLYLAAENASLDVFRLLCDRGANLEYSLALHGAAYGGPSQLPILLYLLEHEQLDVNEYDWYTVAHSGTPLMYAILSGNVEAVRVLLDHNADPEARLPPPHDDIYAMGSATALAGRNHDASEKIVDMLTKAIESKRS